MHEHQWERGAHMAEAFGVDGRTYACAICGEPRPGTDHGGAASPRTEAGKRLLAELVGPVDFEVRDRRTDELASILAIEAEAAQEAPAPEGLDGLARAMHDAAVGCLQPIALSRDVCEPHKRAGAFHLDAAAAVAARLSAGGATKPDDEWDPRVDSGGRHADDPNFGSDLLSRKHRP